MSTQQADILTSELRSYRALLEGVMIPICETHLRLLGSGSKVYIEWDDINLQDQLEAANVRLLNAQARAMEEQIFSEKITEDSGEENYETRAH